MNIVVIGGGAAGASASVRAKRISPSSNVILVEATDMITHGPCAIPYYIEGLVENRSRLTTYTPEYLERERGVRVLTNTRALEVDIDKRIVIVEKKDRLIDKIKWDKLVIATGAMPIVLRDSDRENVVAIRHPAHADKIKSVIGKANTVAIVGGSYLGIEMAEAVSALGKRVLLFEKKPHILPKGLDPELSRVVEEEMKTRGIELHLSESVVEIKGREKAESIVTDKDEYRVDAVVLAIGVKPNVELVKNTGVRLGAEGAIAVNEYMETSVEDVYAAGDVAEKYHKVLRRKIWIPLAPTANKEGQVAGANAAGGNMKFRGIVGTAVTKFYDLYIAKTGLTEEEAIANGIKYRSATVKAKTKAHYYPGASDVLIKMIVNDGDVVIGVQALGKDAAVAYYVDVAAMAIENSMTIEDLFLSDLGYMPATAPVWHPLIVAARVLSRGRF